MSEFKLSKNKEFKEFIKKLKNEFKDKITSENFKTKISMLRQIDNDILHKLNRDLKREFKKIINNLVGELK